MTLRLKESAVATEPTTKITIDSAPAIATPRLLIFTRDDPVGSTGGVETFTQRLIDAFPGSEVVAYAGAAGKRRVFDEARDALAAKPDLFHALVRMRPAAVVANGAAAWALREASAPVVAVYHGTYAGLGRAITPMAPLRGWIARTYGAWMERCATRRRAAVVAVSHGVAEQVRTHYGVHASVRVIENGAAPGEKMRPSVIEARRALRIAEDAKVALYVGRAERTKGFGEVVALARERPKVTVRVAGAAAKTGLPPNLRMMGVVSSDSLRRLTAASDAVVLPSRYEGCSFALIDALVADRPIVATATGCFTTAGEHPFGIVVPLAPTNGLEAPFLAAVDSVLAAPQRFTPRAACAARFAFGRFAAEWRALIREVAPDAK
jgi:glycosyltransferase involved in cell wall biosynthesis